MCFFPVYVKKMDGDRGGFGDIGGGIGAGGQQDKGQNKVRFCIKKIEKSGLTMFSCALLIEAVDLTFC